MKIKWHIYYVDYADEKKERIGRRYNVRSNIESFSANHTFTEGEYRTEEKSWKLWKVVGQSNEGEWIIEDNKWIIEIGIRRTRI